MNQGQNRTDHLLKWGCLLILSAVAATLTWVETRNQAERELYDPPAVFWEHYGVGHDGQVIERPTTRPAAEPPAIQPGSAHTGARYQRR